MELIEEDLLTKLQVWKIFRKMLPFDLFKFSILSIVCNQLIIAI